MKILVIIGSIREGRAGDKLASWVMDQIAQRNSEVDYELFDLKEHPMKLFEEPNHPAMLNGKTSDENANVFIKKVAEADGFVIITPEYNRGTSGALKNAMDYVYNEWNKKPVALLGYGGLSGGARAVEQLRLNLLELQTIPVRESFLVQFIGNHIKDGKFEGGESFEKMLNIVLDQLERFTKALKKVREEL